MRSRQLLLNLLCRYVSCGSERLNDLSKVVQQANTRPGLLENLSCEYSYNNDNCITFWTEQHWSFNFLAVFAKVKKQIWTEEVRDWSADLWSWEVSERCQQENTVYLTNPKPTDGINKVWGAVLFRCVKKMVEQICKDFKRHYLLKLFTTDSVLWLSTPYLIKYSLLLHGYQRAGCS